ncbi:hypothetical protein, partial [Xanthocytophaga flava]|uniref:hypothetical protein n=1 Tax=Xanthocytophaga flava TaxID=3048013 RepID=UPI0028D25CEC
MQDIDFQNIVTSDKDFTELSSYFSNTHLEQLAREVKFIQRTSSRLTAWMFFHLNTCLIKQGGSSSLTDMVALIWNQFGVKLTKQALDERYNLYAVKLMQKCYQFVFEQVLSHTHTMCNPAQESSAQESSAQ